VSFCTLCTAGASKAPASDFEGGIFNVKKKRLVDNPSPEIMIKNVFHKSQEMNSKFFVIAHKTWNKGMNRLKTSFCFDLVTQSKHKLKA